MERIQRSGLIALFLLLAVAVIGLVVGPRKPTEAAVEPEGVVLETGALPGVDLLPPEQRRLFIGSEEFHREPIRHPLRGGSGRSILDDPNAAPARLLDLEGSLFHGVRVREGDTLAAIAGRELGDRKRWREIQELNGIADPKDLRIGQKLRLPPRSSAASADADADAKPRTEAKSDAQQTIQTYVVAKGDTASEISMKVYGTSRHWKRILDANGVRDARLLREGQKLQIPALP